MSKHKLTKRELDAHLSEQLGALQRSAELFDNGYQTEARRMAVTLRVMLHTGRYPSLLKQLEKDNLAFADSALPFNKDNLMPFHGLISLRIGVDNTSYAAKLDIDQSFKRTPFPEWWNAIVFSDSQKRTMSRADIVRTAADQDGGAHVDTILRADYAALRHENSLGWTLGRGQPPTGDAAYAAIRQIAHEVLKTFIPGYRKTPEEVQNSRRPTEISDSKLRFYPHETQFLVNELRRPIVPGMVYEVVIKLDSITTGFVAMVVNTALSNQVTSAGMHRMKVVAGPDQFSGVYGEYTDAVVDYVNIIETGQIGKFCESSPRLVRNK